MVLINTKTHEIYFNVNKLQASKLIGVDRTTIHRWEVKRSDTNAPEVYNHFTIYFKPVNASLLGTYIGGN